MPERPEVHERPVRFFHRGGVVEVRLDAPTRTVLEWLREDVRCTGTKEGCAEGDCGACTVVVGSLDADAPGGLALRPVNACIRFLAALDGKALFTVEDVAPAPGVLHPVQQALVEHHGSQCGFCTPGFVMSLWACHRRHIDAGTQPTRAQLADDLSGNLCRCTGYRPILDAGQAMFQGPAPAFDRAPVVAALRELSRDPPLSAGGWHAPRDLASLATLCTSRPAARLVAGSTDMGLWVTKQLRTLPELVATAEVPELHRLAVEGGRLHFGAAVSLQAAWAVLVGHWPALEDLWLRFASRPIREAGTLGGNIANGSPIGDSAPALMALGAELLLQRGEQLRRLPIEDFYVDYMKNRLQPGEFLRAIELPLPAPRQLVRGWKVSKRFDSDISAVCGVFALDLDGLQVRSARLAYGGLAATVKRAAAAEAALVGRPWQEASVRAAMAALADDYTPLSDMRASAGYRMRVAQNLLWRCWLQTRAQHPLPAAATGVWAGRAQPPG
jgi:xanthine dehydrogenase small subunit